MIKLKTQVLEKENQLLTADDFALLENWFSELDSDVIEEETEFSEDEILEDDHLLEDDRLIDEPSPVKSRKVLIACPPNMPRWENAWWGEKVWLD